MRPRTNRFASAIRHLRRHQGGAAAVEFALILPVFAYLLLGIIEMSAMFYTMTVVDGAVQDAGRRLRTGQAQLSGDTVTDFTTEMCSSLFGVFDCNKIYVDVETFSSFSTISIPIELDEDGVPVTSFSSGGAGDIQAIRAIYTWEFFTPLIGAFFGEGDSNSRTMTTVTVFQNEPYE